MFMYCTFLWICSWFINQQVLMFQIRLVNGSSNLMGRVEVNFNDGSGWGTVCDDDWDNKDAKVVCRNLGVSYNNALALGSAKFGKGTGTIKMDNVNCTGLESTLNSCSFDRSHNCGHHEDASVICWKGDFEPVIENSDSRVAFPRDGGLKVRFTGKENYSASICDDRLARNAIKVACYQKYRTRSSSYFLDTYNSSNIRRTPICLQFNCTGSEYRLSACSSTVLYGSSSYSPTGALCGYDKANRITLKGEHMVGRYIILEKGNKTSIRCETDYAIPKPRIIWHMDGDIVKNGINEWSDVSGSVYKSLSNLTFTPGDLTHGKILTCCSNDTFGHSICTQTYSLFVTDVSKELNLLIIDQPQELTSVTQKIASTASLSMNSEDGILNTHIHIPVLYSLTVCAFLVPLLVLYVYRRRMSNETKQSSTNHLESEMEMENYENVRVCNDYQAEEELYEVPK